MKKQIKNNMARLMLVPVVLSSEIYAASASEAESQVKTLFKGVGDIFLEIFISAAVILGAIVAYKFYFEDKRTAWAALQNILMGLVAFFVVVGVVYLGYEGMSKLNG